MILFPAIDILDGKAVRLLKGDYNQVTVYSERPWEFAQDFVSKGCSAIHIVDLDGAKTGDTVNIKTVEKIAQTKGLYSEIGGGIRSMETVERYLEAGISRVILGTAALKDPAFLKEAIRKYDDRIAVGVDLKDGYVSVKGWIETSDKEGFEFMKELEDIGVSAVIVTDISRDGAMKGTNLELYRRISTETGMKVTASGGISTLDDLKALRAMDIYGAIIGKAYYTGAIRLEDALEVAR
ncbi:MAG TPA: 1-(5-phosphoribosyl)-5-[(5-phosphoribosylamino)methylideneamino]imidazole-4-carboxamide isomerase [Sphaerochaeta sp.]|jgi:phosphoribosylformimino-5-aminoimidazole carboxamide ribotide isomerase|nr:1-(5-phosphoribosyl)-5-[(5-phosphoribosylamino)methylideneamino]imidazole-4-carboxamide isomerase [Sphaerochaeta sp.]